MSVQEVSSEELQRRKAIRKAAKKARIEKREAAKQNNLKQQWFKWTAKFTIEEEAIAEGICACERLARDLEVSTRCNRGNEYFYIEPHQNEDLSKLVQFSELKNLWLKRNQPNILSVKKLLFRKPVSSCQFGY